MDKLLFAVLAVFFVLFGILAVTNVDIVWSRPIMGIAALIAGIICAVRAFK